MQGLTSNFAQSKVQKVDDGMTAAREGRAMPGRGSGCALHTSTLLPSVEGCVSLGRNRPGSVIQDHSKEPMNPLWSRIHGFF